MRKRQLYILSLLSVFCAFGNNCVYGQNNSICGPNSRVYGQNNNVCGQNNRVCGQNRNAYGQNNSAYGQQNSGFEKNHSQFPMERLDRGLVALPAAGKGIYLSWRLLGTDSKNVCFDIERD